MARGAAVTFAGQKSKKIIFPLTRAKASNFTETSRYEDVINFISELQKESNDFNVEYFGTTFEGKKLPLVIFSQPKVFSPLEAKRLGKPIVFVMANIHAGEVEGKEAAQMIMREMVDGKLKPLLKNIVLLVAPIYNADGNDRISVYHRTDQNGPLGGVGTRANAQGFDLNRDYMKLESPEVHGLVTNVFDKWDPDVFIDLHTTDGSYHGYALTYAPPLNPNTDAKIIAFEKGKLFPAVSKILLRKYNYRTYYYGDFVNPENPYDYLDPDSSYARRAWATFDEHPRFGTNYLGLRNRLTVLSEAYSHLDFKTRIDVTKKFVVTILRFVVDNHAAVLNLTNSADAFSTATGLTRGNKKGYGVDFKFKASPRPVTIFLGSVKKVLDERTGKYRVEAIKFFKPVKMIEYENFEATKRAMPPAAYILQPDEENIAKLLMMHGISVARTLDDTTLNVEEYVVTGLVHDSVSFQKHYQTKLDVREKGSVVQFLKGSYLISTHQPEAALIFYLLEPMTDDGLADWNFFDQGIEAQLAKNSTAVYPVFRLESEPRMPSIIFQ